MIGHTRTDMLQLVQIHSLDQQAEPGQSTLAMQRNTFTKPYSTYPVAHVLVGMVELGNQGRILSQLAFSNADAVLEAHQLCLQLCH